MGSSIWIILNDNPIEVRQIMEQKWELRVHYIVLCVIALCGAM